MQHAHPNNAVLWDSIGCQRGCLGHATTTARIDLGASHRYTDLTSIPSRFARKFDLEVWDTSVTPVDGGPYCPARDAVSETIQSHHIWEPAETAIMLMCFEDVRQQVFIDFGSQLGWFTTLAGLAGMATMAYEADPDCAALTECNFIANRLNDTGIVVNQERVTPDTPALSPDWFLSSAIVVKLDIEGAEVDGVRMLQPLIDKRMIKYMLIEVSPVFNDSYEGLINGLVDDGFVPYMLPPKRQPPVQINQLSDLVSYELPHEPRDIARYIDGLHQADVFFVHGGIQ